jgi:outer membrane lipoprotein-sorting protein
LNNLTRHQDERFEPEDRQSQMLSDDLQGVFHLPVPSVNFDPSAVRSTREASAVRRRWRPALIAASAAAGLALFLVGPSLMGGSTQNVSAQEVLARTQGVAATNSLAENTQSYHMVATSEMFAPIGADSAAQDSTVETWYQDPQHQRSETYDADGRLVFGSAQYGDDLWFYSATDDVSAGDDGSLRVVRTSNSAMGFTTLGPQDFGATSLSSLLDSYSNHCATADKVGEETVAGRPTYVIEIKQTPETCDLKPVATQDGDKTSVRMGGDESGAGMAPLTVSGEAKDGEKPSFQIVETTTRIWVDQETFITLKSETDSDTGPMFRYEVTDFDLNPDFDPSAFNYEAPEGIDVVKVDAPQDVKMVLSGGESGTGIGVEGHSIENAPAEGRQP